MTSPATRTAAAPSPPRVLDPRMLGRPVHLLDRFADSVKDDFAELLRGWLNRRYRADFQVGEVAMQRLNAMPAATRWLACAAACGVIQCAIDRRLVLGVLAYRYGLPSAPPAPEADAPPPEPPPETATEERLAAVLHQRLAAVLVQRIDSGLAGPARAATTALDFSAEGHAPVAGSWCLRAEIGERSQGLSSTLCFAFDEGWMAHLLRRLGQRAEAAQAAPREKGAEAPLGERLQLRLVARLLQKHLTLGELADLRIGDVIPVSMGTTDVLIDGSPLFSATVAEHRGKLCLTGFEDLE